MCGEDVKFASDNEGYVETCFADSREGDDIYIRWEDVWGTGCPVCGDQCWSRWEKK